MTESVQQQDEYWTDHAFEPGRREWCGHVVFLVEGGFAVRCEKTAGEHAPKIEGHNRLWDRVDGP